jgi:hypothetical protein
MPSNLWVSRYHSTGNKETGLVRHSEPTVVQTAGGTGAPAGLAFSLEDALGFTWEAGTAPHKLLREARAKSSPPALAQMSVINLMDVTLGECDFMWGRIYPSLGSNQNAI